MGNYFNEPRRIVNNSPQLTHQATIETWLRKSPAQERSKSNPESRNQIKVSSIKFWKCFAKFMTPTALFKKPTHILESVYVPGDTIWGMSKVNTKAIE